jgi:hypothetical protein
MTADQRQAQQQRGTDMGGVCLVGMWVHGQTLTGRMCWGKSVGTVLTLLCHLPVKKNKRNVLING